MMFMNQCCYSYPRTFSLVSLVMVLVLWLAVSASFADKVSPISGGGVVGQVDIIDYEILLLKAEIAEKTEHNIEFLKYMQQLERWPVPSQFLSRIEHLRLRMQILNESSVRSINGFEQARNAQSFVILLPMSGDLAPAGQAVLDALEQALADRKFFVLDTSLYDDMDELWRLVSLFEPDAIIGPLQKDKAQALALRNEGIPMLVFSSIERSASMGTHILSLASHARVAFEQVQPFLARIPIEQVALLVDDSAFASEWLAHIRRYQAMVDPLGVGENETNSTVLNVYKVEQSIDKTIEQLSGASESWVRIHWLASTIQRSLENLPYVRKDLRLILALLPQASALQVAPLLNYYQLKAPIIWLPSVGLDAKAFELSLSSWQSTYGLLAGHFVYQNPGLLADDEKNSKLGLFYALGDLAVHLIKLAEHPKPFLIQHELGEVVMMEQNHYYLKSKLVKLDNGRLQEQLDLDFVD